MRVLEFSGGAVANVTASRVSTERVRKVRSSSSTGIFRSITLGATHCASGSSSPACSRNSHLKNCPRQESNRCARAGSLCRRRRAHIRTQNQRHGGACR